MRVNRVALFLVLLVGQCSLRAQAPATSKSVYLEAVESAGDSRTTDHWRSVYGAYSKTKSGTRELGISVRNLSALPGQFEVEWFFIGKPASGGTKFLYDKGSRAVTLSPGKFENFVVESKELSTRSTRDYYYWNYNYKSGDKPDGWILRARVGDEVVRVKASSPILEQLEKNKEEFERFVGKQKK